VDGLRFFSVRKRDTAAHTRHYLQPYVRIACVVLAFGHSIASCGLLTTVVVLGWVQLWLGVQQLRDTMH